MADRRRLALKAAVWAGAALPLALLVLAAATDGLGAEPVESITHRTGWAALTMLMATLAVTPARRLTGWNALAPVRRTLGLWAFAYAVIHFCIYLFDQWFDWGLIVEDVLERPYVTVGFTALLLLFPLALTSTKGWIRRLGKRWQTLHRLVYVAAGLGVLHFLWLVKRDLREPLVFAAVYTALMAFRLPPLRPKRRPAPRPRTPAREPATAERP